MPEPPIYEFDDFRIDPARRLLLQRGEPVPLKPRVFDTLLYLASNQGRVLEKDELMRAIWPDAVVEENNLNQNISSLRRALGESRGENRYIVTVPGRGYQFAKVVKTAMDAPAASRPEGQPGSACCAARNSWCNRAGNCLLAPGTSGAGQEDCGPAIQAVNAR